MAVLAFAEFDEPETTTDRGQIVMEKFEDDEIENFHRYCSETQGAVFHSAFRDVAAAPQGQAVFSNPDDEDDDAGVFASVFR